jgi:hypothetical protein
MNPAPLTPPLVRADRWKHWYNRCGISDFAQAALGGIIFVDLPDVCDEFDRGDSSASVESTKTASSTKAVMWLASNIRDTEKQFDKKISQ